MNTIDSVERDERTLAVENASYRWAYIFLAYALLIDVMYRGIVHDEAAWDLLAFVIVGGFVCTIYQARQKTLARGWVTQAVLIACVGGVIAALTAVILTKMQAG